MAVTRLVRKARRNRVVSRQRQDNMKRLLSKPVIKNVDVEQIKEEFEQKKASLKKNSAPKAPAKAEKAEVTEVIEKVETPQPESEAKPRTEAKEQKKEATPKAPKKSKKTEE